MISLMRAGSYLGAWIAGDGTGVSGATSTLRQSMTVKTRTVTAFIGPSGCGKSTLLRALDRMHEVIPDAYVRGRVELDGTDLYGDGATR